MNDLTIHDEIDDWMAGALCGALSPDEQQNFERHLAECPRCRSLYEENKKMNDMLEQHAARTASRPQFRAARHRRVPREDCGRRFPSVARAGVVCAIPLRAGRPRAADPRRNERGRHDAHRRAAFRFDFGVIGFKLASTRQAPTMQRRTALRIDVINSRWCDSTACRCQTQRADLPSHVVNGSQRG